MISPCFFIQIKNFCDRDRKSAVSFLRFFARQEKIGVLIVDQRFIL